jgi:uncharacterized protein (TIGR03437 family)
MILSVFGSSLAGTTASASSVPLPFSMAGVAATVNGVAAPLYFVSNGQLNIQIPYETPANGTVTLAINNNGSVASKTFSMSAAAPGIFADASGSLVPSATAVRGQAISLYVTGYGSVSPAVSTGAAPASTAALSSLPRPVQNVGVTIGSAPATILFVGVPPGLVGVLQINCVVPSGAPFGSQTAVVNVGGVQSTPVKLTVTN